MRQTKIARNIWLGIENLLLHKLRSFLTMLGVVFGVGSVVAMLSVGEGASKEALTQIRRLGSNNIIISSVKPAEEQATNTMRASMSVYGLTYEDHRRMSESLEERPPDRAGQADPQGLPSPRAVDGAARGGDDGGMVRPGAARGPGRPLADARRRGGACPRRDPDRVRRPQAAGHREHDRPDGADRGQRVRDHRHRQERERAGRQHPDPRPGDGRLHLPGGGPPLLRRHLRANDLRLLRAGAGGAAPDHRPGGRLEARGGRRRRRSRPCWRGSTRRRTTW